MVQKHVAVGRNEWCYRSVCVCVCVGICGFVEWRGGMVVGTVTISQVCLFVCLFVCVLVGRCPGC